MVDQLEESPGGCCIPHLIYHTLRRLLLIALQQATEHSRAQCVKAASSLDKPHSATAAADNPATSSTAQDSTAPHVKGGGCIPHLICHTL
jgi:hypothetical protein